MAAENLLFDQAKRESLAITCLCGVDEAGRGPLAGPVFAAAVIFDPDNVPEGLNDSKKLSEKKREQLFDQIVSRALAYGIAQASVEEIEQINILQATMLAMQRAVEAMPIKPEYILVDGNRLPQAFAGGGERVIKGDALSASIAAASILAKVSRDRLLKEYAQQYPEYGFEKHKGYGTAEHMQAIRQHGILPIHRRSFLKNL